MCPSCPSLLGNHPACMVPRSMRLADLAGCLHVVCPYPRPHLQPACADRPSLTLFGLHLWASFFRRRISINPFLPQPPPFRSLPVLHHSHVAALSTTCVSVTIALLGVYERRSQVWVGSVSLKGGGGGTQNGRACIIGPLSAELRRGVHSGGSAHSARAALIAGSTEAERRQAGEERG